MVWNVSLTGIVVAGANGQSRSHGHLGGPTSPHDFPDQTG